MNQHSIQKAYLKSFANGSGRLWVYPKMGGRPFPKPPGECTADEDFQSPGLEIYQNKIIETPGIKALRAAESLTASEYEQISLWMGLHIIRNPKARRELFSSAQDYEQRFHAELEKQRLFADYDRNVYPHICDSPRFLITSDNPVIEFEYEGFFVRCCLLSPRKLIVFSFHDRKLDHEVGLEEFVNAMVWGAAGDFIYSHRADVQIEHFKGIAEAYGLEAVIEDLTFVIHS